MDWAQLLRQNVRPAPAVATTIAEHLVTVAANAQADARLARHLQREAAAWFAGSDQERSNACLEHAARTYVREADARIATDPESGALVEGHFLERAIAGLTKLPRRYRESKNLDEEIAELRQRLSASRETARESMVTIKTEPVDISELTAHARAHVSGQPSAWEALARFATLAPPIDADATRQSATKLASGSLAALFPSTTFSRDGRKVAARQGSLDAGEPAVWAQMVSTVAIHADMIAKGAILPAQRVLTFEHSFDRELLTRVAQESPTVPEGHASLWAAGLTLGLSEDYGVAVTVLVPQLEHLVRRLVKSRGVHTLHVNEQGVETEKGLGMLLQLPEATEILGAGIALELQALLLEQASANLRNDIAHGLIDDANAWSYAAVYVWWICLRLVVVPLWNTAGPTADIA